MMRKKGKIVGSLSAVPPRSAKGSTSPRRIRSSIPVSVASGVRELGGSAALLRSLPPKADLLGAARVFGALSDPARIRILAAISRTRLCPCLLQQVEPMKDSVLSYHLRVLRDARLVERVAISNYRVYRATRLGTRFVADVSRGLSQRAPSSSFGGLRTRAPRSDPPQSRRTAGPRLRTGRPPSSESIFP